MEILRTKLYPPAVIPDLVRRERLYEQLDRGFAAPLTLISAPAGYGKSTLMASWVESRDEPCAWVSLDEADRDIGTFCGHIVASIRSFAPEACPQTAALLQAPQPPPLPLLARCLANDLEAIDTAFILALDDYHLLRGSSASSELVEALLRHPPRGLHLVISTRRDPALPLASLRANRQMTDVRLQDLEFTGPEVGAFLQAEGFSLSDHALAHLRTHVEGWAVGLRLTCLAMRHHQDPDTFLRELRGNLSSVQDYLTGEILDRQSPDMQRWLTETSILNRFCAPLCDELRISDQSAGGTGMDGASFCEALRAEGLLAIALDSRAEWYRYHHLFQDFLQRRLQRTHTATEITALHQRAGRWFDGRGLVDDSIRHSLAAADPEAIAALIERYGNQLMERQQRARLDGWLDLLPPEIVDRHPILLMFRAWSVAASLRVPELKALIEVIDERIAEADLPPAECAAQQACLDAYRACCSYLNSQGEQAVAHADRAIELIPERYSQLRVHSVNWRALSLQMVGRYDEAVSSLSAAIRQERNAPAKVYLLAALGQVVWAAADLYRTLSVAGRLEKAREEAGILPGQSWGHYLRGIVEYQHNDLGAAEAKLKPLSENPHAALPFVAADATATLALVYQAQGRYEESRAVADSIADHAVETAFLPLERFAGAVRADVALRQGRLDQAFRWAQEQELGDIPPMSRTLVPQLTLARILTAHETPDSRHRAMDLLSRAESSMRTTHNRSILIRVLIQKALLLDSRGDRTAALETLSEALSEAEAGRCLRFFLDSGPPVAELLAELPARRAGSGFIDGLLAAFQQDEASAAPQTAGPRDRATATAVSHTLIDPLTNRETDVLELLADRLRDKEIAERLFISPQTVKSHLRNVYSKLEVGSRREAAARALELGIIMPR